MLQFNNLKVLGFNLQPKFYGIIKFISNEYQRTGRPLSVGITSFLDIQKKHSCYNRHRLRWKILLQITYYSELERELVMISQTEKAH